MTLELACSDEQPCSDAAAETGIPEDALGTVAVPTGSLSHRLGLFRLLLVDGFAGSPSTRPSCTAEAGSDALVDEPTRGDAATESDESAADVCCEGDFTRGRSVFINGLGGRGGT